MSNTQIQPGDRGASASGSSIISPSNPGETADVFTNFGTAESDIVIGQPVKAVFGEGDLPLGPCNAAAAQCLGVALQSASAGRPVKYQFVGIVTLKTEEWDALTGDSGGLGRDNVYYVSQSTPGNLTVTPPSTGQPSIQIGTGLNATQMQLTISPSTVAP